MNQFRLPATKYLQFRSKKQHQRRQLGLRRSLLQLHRLRQLGLRCPLLQLQRRLAVAPLLPRLLAQVRRRLRRRVPHLARGAREALRRARQPARPHPRSGVASPRGPRAPAHAGRRRKGKAVVASCRRGFVRAAGAGTHSAGTLKLWRPLEASSHSAGIHWNSEPLGIVVGTPLGSVVTACARAGAGLGGRAGAPIGTG